MPSQHIFVFPPFRLDPHDARLWRGEEVLALTPKAFAVLLYLVQHAGQLVSKDTLLETCWPETSVGDAVLKVCLAEIRKALGDTARTPRFIATQYRRGYRFIAPVVETEPAPATAPPLPRPRPLPRTSHTRLPERPCVGRTEELAQLGRWFQQAQRGERHMIFVSGAAGIGKTALLEAFLAQHVVPTGSRIARGQCIAHHGPGEAYMPILEALGRLCRAQENGPFVDLLRQHAPTWFVQMPWLLTATDRATLQRELFGATRERMLREMAETVERLSADTPLVLVLEDLHWSDYATLDLLAVLARRREPARFCVLCTYRPAEALERGHPLRQVTRELHMHGHGRELPLLPLSEAAVATYLATMCAGQPLPEGLARVVHQHTGGHPFFLVNVVAHLIEQPAWQRLTRLTTSDELGRLMTQDIPENLRQMILQQIEQVSPDVQRILEAVSVAGQPTTVAAVADALGVEIEHVEACCERLGQGGQFLRLSGMEEWPDGTVSTCYEFQHALYQQVMYERIAAGRRVRLHQRLGLAKERAYGARACDIAAELAAHFVRGGDDERAMRYLQQAATNATQRYAHREAIAALTQAVHLATRSQTATRYPVYAPLLMQRGIARRSMGDMRGAGEDFAALVELTQASQQLDGEVRALLALSSALFWTDRARCLAVSARAVALGRQLDDPVLQAHAYGYDAYWQLQLRGWRDTDAQACAAALEAVRQINDAALLGLYLTIQAHHQCIQSVYHDALQTLREALGVTQAVGDVHHYLTCQFLAAWALFHGDRLPEAFEVLGEALHMATKNEHALARMFLQLERAWFYALLGDFPQARTWAAQGLRDARASKHKHGQLLGWAILGYAELGEAQLDSAQVAFASVRDWLTQDSAVTEWPFLFIVYFSLSAYALRCGDLDQARHAAERLRALATATGECTYMALAYWQLAEVACAAQQWSEADATLAQARAVLQRQAAPMVGRRVQVTSVRVRAQHDAL